MEHILESPNKTDLMAELFSKKSTKSAKRFLMMPRTLFEEQGNLEAHEILMITDTVQCKSYYNHTTSGHTYCNCGFILLVKKQVLKNVMNCFSILTTSAFSFQNRKSPEGKP